VFEIRLLQKIPRENFHCKRLHMNERIDELMIQAGARFEMMNWVHYDDFEYKKFAELIVRECLDQLLVSDPTEDFDKGISWSVEQIKNHFGVEE
jgi:hypothetical protein